MAGIMYWPARDKKGSMFELLTMPVNVQPGTRRCTLVLVSRRSQLRCSARVLTADLDALYAAFPGGLVMPCLLPVMTMEVGRLLAAS